MTPGPAIETTEPWRWDRYNRTAQGRYLFAREWDFLRRALRGRPAPRRVVDVGAGSGRFAVRLHQAGWRVVAVEPDPRPLAALRRRGPAIPAVLAAGERLPLADGCADCLVAFQVFEYMRHRAFLAEARRALAGGGLLVFDALNSRGYKARLNRAAGRRLDKPSADLGYPEIVRALDHAGFSLHRVEGYSWLPFRRESDNPLVPVAAWAERVLRLDALPALSPKILVAATRRG